MSYNSGQLETGYLKTKGRAKVKALKKKERLKKIRQAVRLDVETTVVYNKYKGYN